MSATLDFVKSTIVTIIVLLTLAASACKKEDEDPIYPKTVVYEATCDTCIVTYLDEGGVSVQQHISGSTDHTFTMRMSRYLSISAIDFDTLGTTSVRILVDGGVFRSASNTGALDTTVQASGWY